MTTSEANLFLRHSLTPIYGEREAKAMTAIIFDEVMHYSAVDVILRADSLLPDFVPRKLAEITARLTAGEPLQYILGVARFHGHRFRVSPATLIPRPETERLVDIITDQYASRTDLRVADLGTGSGCIAISLALALKFARVTAIDISAEALDVARENAVTLRARVNFTLADILTMPPPATPCLDIIVSNPPYVCTSEQAQIEANVLQYEPHSALFVPDDDPLLFYRPIARFAAAALAPGGRLFLECNRRFTPQVAHLLTSHGFTATEQPDQFGAPRFVIATKPL